MFASGSYGRMMLNDVQKIGEKDKSGDNYFMDLPRE